MYYTLALISRDLHAVMSRLTFVENLIQELVSAEEAESVGNPEEDESSLFRNDTNRQHTDLLADLRITGNNAPGLESTHRSLKEISPPHASAPESQFVDIPESQSESQLSAKFPLKLKKKEENCEAGSKECSACLLELSEPAITLPCCTASMHTACAWRVLHMRCSSKRCPRCSVILSTNTARFIDEAYLEKDNAMKF
mmetsp:Transcript_3151/g.5536  ORF Transcript_3151/g.5536 Transcript_3151/m.5536 type:complete len:198 (-) Transcript_3151:197-790(-)